MKKYVIALFVVLLTACSLAMNNTPKAKVKELLDRYKNQDSSIISNLDDSISSEYSGIFKDRYKALIINQYKNLEYKIKDEVIDGNTAIVTADVTVYNYGSAIDAANNYLVEHEKEFYTSTLDDSDLNTQNNADDETEKNENTSSENQKTIDYDKFLDYKLTLLEGITDRKTYSIDFTLTRENDQWTLDNLTDDAMKKIHGLYTE